MTSNSAGYRVGQKCADGATAHSTIAFAAIGDHVRLPARFFARLFASAGSLLRR
jgi:hypothetical protein